MSLQIFRSCGAALERWRSGPIKSNTSSIETLYYSFTDEDDDDDDDDSNSQTGMFRHYSVTNDPRIVRNEPTLGPTTPADRTVPAAFSGPPENFESTQNLMYFRPSRVQNRSDMKWIDGSTQRIHSTVSPSQFLNNSTADNVEYWNNSEQIVSNIESLTDFDSFYRDAPLASSNPSFGRRDHVSPKTNLSNARSRNLGQAHGLPSLSSSQSKITHRSTPAAISTSNLYSGAIMTPFSSDLGSSDAGKYRLTKSLSPITPDPHEVYKTLGLRPARSTAVIDELMKFEEEEEGEESDAEDIIVQDKGRTNVRETSRPKLGPTQELNGRVTSQPSLVVNRPGPRTVCPMPQRYRHLSADPLEGKLGRFSELSQADRNKNINNDIASKIKHDGVGRKKIFARRQTADYADGTTGVHLDKPNPILETAIGEYSPCIQNRSAVPPPLPPRPRRQLSVPLEQIQISNFFPSPRESSIEVNGIREKLANFLEYTDPTKPYPSKPKKVHSRNNEPILGNSAQYNEQSSKCFDHNDPIASTEAQSMNRYPNEVNPSKISVGTTSPTSAVEQHMADIAQSYGIMTETLQGSNKLKTQQIYSPKQPAVPKIPLIPGLDTEIDKAESFPGDRGFAPRSVVSAKTRFAARHDTVNKVSMPYSPEKTCASTRFGGRAKSSGDIRARGSIGGLPSELRRLAGNPLSPVLSAPGGPPFDIGFVYNHQPFGKSASLFADILERAETCVAKGMDPLATWLGQSTTTLGNSIINIWLSKVVVVIIDNNSFNDNPSCYPSMSPRQSVSTFCRKLQTAFRSDSVSKILILAPDFEHDFELGTDVEFKKFLGSREIGPEISQSMIRARENTLNEGVEGDVDKLIEMVYKENNSSKSNSIFNFGMLL